MPTDFASSNYVELNFNLNANSQPTSTPAGHQQHNGYHAQLELDSMGQNASSNFFLDRTPTRVDHSASSDAENCLQEISHLSGRLYTHSMTIPNETPQYQFSNTSQIPPGPPHIDKETTSYACSYESQFDLSVTMELTQAMSDLYQRFMAIPLYFVPKKASVAGTNHDSSPFNSRSDPALSSAAEVSGSSKLDHSSILLILACHLRLINCWDSISRRIGDCTSTALTHGKGSATSAMQIMSVGNFKLSETHAASMQFLLLVHLLHQLWERSSELVIAVQSSTHKISTEKEASECDSTAVLTEQMCLEVQARAEFRMRQLEKTRTLLISRNLLYGMRE